MKKDLVNILQDCIQKYWDMPVFTDFHGETMQYKDLARKIAKLHLLYESAGIKPGDKIALCGKNSSRWAVAFLATMTYGAVIVPLLHEFKAENLHHLVNHSDARLFFVDESIWEHLDPEQMKNLEGVIGLKDFKPILSRNEKFNDAATHLNELFGNRYPSRFTKADVKYFEVTDPNSLAVINYTSGSTGFSKGVMIPHRALWSNADYMIHHLDIPSKGSSMVCMLPMAHMYGLVTEMIHATVKGAHLYFLTRQPSPKVLLEAFRTTRPELIITVPLIIEKIIKTKVFPTLDKPLTRLLLRTPLVDRKILAKVKEALMTTFGGNLKMMIVGGAGLNREVEEFLLRIKFPITVGYGMTECAPLIGYAHAKDFRSASCGQLVPRMQIKVLSPDPENIPGEIMVKGDNVMLGYYKNPEATQAVMRPDGWMLTGDVGTIDKDGFIYIRGRNKTMILGPSGQNIYPEEIEQKLNNMPMVAESLVIDSGEGKLTALIYPDQEIIDKEALSPEQVHDRLAKVIAEVNPQLEAYSRIANFKVMKEEFEKTPKRSLKRYLYVNN